MKKMFAINICYLLFSAFAAGAQNIGHYEEESKNEWALSFSLGNAGINQGIFELSNQSGDSRFFYDQFNIDNLSKHQYSVGIGIAKEVKKINYSSYFEKGVSIASACIGNESSLSYSEIEFENKYLAFIPNISHISKFGKLSFATGLTFPFIVSKGNHMREYFMEKDSLNKILSESLIDYKYPELYSFGLGVINEIKFSLSKTILLSSSLGYFFLYSKQSGYKTGTEVSYPFYNVNTFSRMYQKTTAIKFSGIDLQIKLSINLKNLIK